MSNTIDQDLIDHAKVALPDSMQAEFGNILTAPAIVTTQYFTGITPSANEIVRALAMAFRVNEVRAHQYLLEADFSKWGK